MPPCELCFEASLACLDNPVLSMWRLWRVFAYADPFELKSLQKHSCGDEIGVVGGGNWVTCVLVFGVLQRSHATLRIA